MTAAAVLLQKLKRNQEAHEAYTSMVGRATRGASVGWFNSFFFPRSGIDCALDRHTQQHQREQRS
jgi:hypothetical protein